MRIVVDAVQLFMASELLARTVGPRPQAPGSLAVGVSLVGCCVLTTHHTDEYTPLLGPHDAARDWSGEVHGASEVNSSEQYT